MKFEKTPCKYLTLYVINYMIENHSFLYPNQSCQTNSVSITGNNYSNQTAEFTYSGRSIFLLIDPAKIRTQWL